LDAKFFLQIFSNYSENFMFQTFSYQFFSFSPLKIFFFENLLSQNNKKLLKKKRKNWSEIARKLESPEEDSRARPNYVEMSGVLK